MPAPTVPNSFIAAVFLVLLFGTCVVSLVTKSLVVFGAGILFTFGIPRALIGKVSK